MPLLVEFEEHQEEKTLIGEMLIAYGELEFAIVQMLAHAFTKGNDTSARLMFRVRGESARIEVADAILRPELETIGLGGKWSNAIGALRYCKEVRNQYAHCHWWKTKDQPLCFMNLDSDATAASGEMTVSLEPVDLPLIRQQRQYFEYTSELLYYLESRYRERLGKEADAAPEPKSIPQPPKNNRKALLAARSETGKS
jgi:hypothetical protein